MAGRPPILLSTRATRPTPLNVAPLRATLLRVRMVILFVLLVVPGAVAGGPRPVSAAPGGFAADFPRVGVINFTNCNPTCADPAATMFSTSVAPRQLFVDAPRRRVYAYRAGNSAAFPRGIAVIDADRLVQTGWIDLSGCKLPQRVPQSPADCGTVAGGSNDYVIPALDQARRRLYLGELGSYLGCPGAALTPSAQCADAGRFAVVDLTTSNPTPTIVTLPKVANVITEQRTEFSDGDTIVGLVSDDARKRLYVLTSSSDALTSLGLPVDVKGTSILAYDTTNLTTASRPLWTYRVRPCHKILAQKSTGAYFDVGADGRFLYFACQGSAAGVAALHGVARVNLGDPVGTDPTGGFTTEFFPFAGNLTRGYSLGDRGNDRVAIGVAGVGLQRLYVFDALHRSWVASMVLPGNNTGGGGADPHSGRIYVLNDDFGLRYVDASALPAVLGQPITVDHRALGKDLEVDPQTRRVFLPGQSFPALDGGTPHPNAHLWVFEDRTAPYDPPADQHPDKRTHQIDEEDASSVSHSAGGTAYGVRSTLVGGVAGIKGGEAIALIPEEAGALRPEGGDRGLFLGHIPKAQLSGEVTRGEAKATASAVRMDEATAADLKGKYGFATGQAGIGKEGAPPCNDAKPGPECLAFDELSGNVRSLQEAKCSDLGGKDDPINGNQSGSKVSCRRLDKVQAWASATTATQVPVETGDVTFSVGSSEARVDVTKDAKNGVTTISRSFARDVTLTVPGLGALSIGEINSMAKTTAAGKEDTATSDLEAYAKNVRIVDAEGKLLFSCGVPNADAHEDECEPANAAEAINRYFSPRVQARGPRRDMDPLYLGSPGGAQAIVAKDRYARWSDLAVSGDLQREVTGLEITAYNDDVDASRVVLELAGVYAESQYQIGEPKQKIAVLPTKLTVELKDKDGKPLAGGVFRIEGGDVLDLEAAPAKTCVTTDDGVGNCVFEDLAAGSYTVRQTAAPAGYATGPDTPVTLSPGSHTRASFTNLRAVGSIVLGLADEGGEDRPAGPLAGGTFELSADNGDLRLGEGDSKLGSCTTDAEGVCGFEEVPLGKYVVHQSAGPDGYLTADDVGFELTEPEQTAAIVFVVGLTAIDGTPGSDAAAPVEEARDTAFVDAPTDTASIEIETPPSAATKVRTAPFRGRRGAIERAVAAPSEALAFLSRQPRQALLFVLMWVLLLAPVYLAVRRRTLIVAKGVV